jgi:hypothetical protein
MSERLHSDYESARFGFRNRSESGGGDLDILRQMGLFTDRGNLWPCTKELLRERESGQVAEAALIASKASPKAKSGAGLQYPHSDSVLTSVTIASVTELLCGY